MARQVGIITVSGTLDGITYYYAFGQHLCRKKTSLNKDRIMNDPAFAAFRSKIAPFVASSKLAAILYKQLSPKQKGHGVIRKLVKEIWPMVLQKRSKKKILAYMQQRYGIVVNKVANKIKNKKAAPGIAGTAILKSKRTPACANHFMNPLVDCLSAAYRNRLMNEMMLPQDDKLINFWNDSYALTG